jgi:sugar lactone lactonase YvrE
MKSLTLCPAPRCSRQARAGLGWLGLGVVLALGCALPLAAAPEVTTLTQIPYFTHPNYHGYLDGSTPVSRFYTPHGLAMDGTGQFLFVADRDNNAIREIKLALNQTLTFVPNPTLQGNPLNKPVGVAVDSARNVYVLNRGNGSNGNVLKFNQYGELVATFNATPLVNAAGIALDAVTNIYVTVQGNTLMRITPTGVPSTIVTIAHAGASLQGITVKRNGQIAAADAGRHGIYLIDPATGVVTTNTGFNGVGDYTGLNNQGATKANAKFNQPYGVAEAGDGSLVVADFGNHRVKVAQPNGVVTNLYGVSSSYWVGPLSPSQNIFPGWWDGTVSNVDVEGGVEARSPVGVVFAPNGTAYTTETYYHVVRQVTGSGLPLPPPPPTPVPPPRVGWVDFTIPPAIVVSVLQTGPNFTTFTFNNDQTIAVEGTSGTETHYTSGATPGGVDTVPDPSPTSGSTPPVYHDGMFPNEVPPSIIAPQPDVTVKAISFQSGRPSSTVIQARFIFKAASPVISGDNAASFSVDSQTVGAEMWYTTDGSDPVNAPPSVGPISGPANLSLNITTNTTFRIRAFRNNYQSSEIASRLFSPTNFNANKISFGFEYGEASSDFVASAGQFFYAPVTLSILPQSAIYSLQFNVTVTNAGPGPAVAPGAVGFESFLQKPIPGITPPIYERIPPLSFAGYQADPPPASSIVYYDGMPFVDMTFVNTNNNLNLLGVGWLERYTKTNLYDTTKQDLIKYSQPHDTLFDEVNGKVVLGGYAFQVPGNAQPGQTYQIQIGLPSATSDGIGAPGSTVYIATPTNGSLAAGALNTIKHVAVGQRKYLAGDSAPFRWFNAGDFGNTNLDNSDVMQVFQSAIYSFNMPPPGSDFFDAMDSCGVTYADGPGYLVADTNVTSVAALNGLFNGNDTLINAIAFGDGFLDVCDVYVTFRRSLDPSLTNFRRFWTNGVRAAEIAGPGLPQPVVLPAVVGAASVNFSSGDLMASAAQTVQIPITAKVAGTYPIRSLMLNLSVTPLDGSPALTVPAQFSPNPALGSPTLTSSKGNGNYAATWLNNNIPGLTGDATLGTLTVQIPAGAGSSAAYAVHFEHASASPNGLASFPKQKRPGLITLSDRSASSWNDGISDEWRLRHFGSIYNVLSAASADADGDGHTNLAEFRTGTDPNDSVSVLKVLSKRSGGQFAVRWPSVPGKSYVIERAGALFADNWLPVSTNLGTGWDMEFNDPDLTGTPRFYRVRVAE